MTGQPTAAEVLREHAFEGTRPGELPGGWCAGCTWGGADDPSNPHAFEHAHAQHQADMLAAAGLLVTPEHDAQVAARALRAFATHCDGQENDAAQGGEGSRLYAAAWADAATEARDQADRIERGEAS